MFKNKNKKVYVIGGDKFKFLSKKTIKKNLSDNTNIPHFFVPSTFKNVWVTANKFEAEKKWEEVKRYVINPNALDVGVIELDNSDGLYDVYIA